MAKRFLKFGGPELPEGSHTWFEATDQMTVPCGHCQRTGEDRQGKPCLPCKGKGAISMQDAPIQAPPGLVVPIEYVPFPRYFVKTGRASIIDEQGNVLEAAHDPNAP